MRTAFIAAVVAFLAVIGTTGSAAAGDTPERCRAEYEAAGQKVPGQPRLLTLTNYGCGLFASQASDTIFKGFVDADYRGDYLEIGWGECDEDGIRVDEFPIQWQNKISSFRVFQNCRHVRLYEGKWTSGHCEKYEDDQKNVGGRMNDKSKSMRTQSVMRNC